MRAARHGVECYFRLRGEVEGVESSFTVRPGENLIGSRPENHITLRDRSVSRRHALLIAGPGRLVLEDLASTNGTRVNSRRIDRATVKAGDLISFGMVNLRVEEVEAADADLAIAVDTPPFSPSSRAGDSTEASLSDGTWLVFLQSITDRLLREPGSAGTALAELAQALRARAACLLSWDGDGDPVVIAGSGAFAEAHDEEDLGAVVRSARSGPGSVAAVLDGRVPLVCAVRVGELEETTGLVVAGEFPGRRDSLLLLRTVLDVLCLARGRAAPDDAATHRPLGALRFPAGYVVGESEAMASIYREMRTLSDSDLPVLIVGETGVGKEHIARALHLSSPRATAPFVAINCAAIPAELLEAELFGISKGVATGVAERAGKFQQAEGGTIFLDEIAEMPPELQAKLLRALQEREVHPLGGRSPVAIDLSVLAATNADPQRLLAEGRLRPDLYYRLAGAVLEVPPLRRRRDDIPRLVEHFTRVCAAQAGKRVTGVTVKALSALVEYHWPGNVRELEHEVRRAVSLCPAGQAIDCTVLRAHLLAPGSATGAVDDDPRALLLDVQVERLERLLIMRALQASRGSRSEAARLLGISRNGLALKMKRLGLQGL